MQETTVRMSMLSLDRGRKSGGKMNEKGRQDEESSMGYEHMKFSGTVAEDEEDDTISELRSFSFALKADSSGLPEDIEGVIDSCLKDLDKILERRHKMATLKWSLATATVDNLPVYLGISVKFSPNLPSDGLQYMNDRMKEYNVLLVNILLDKLRGACDEYIKNVTEESNNCVAMAQDTIGRSDEGSGRALRALLNRARERKDVWQERYQRATKARSKQDKEESKEEVPSMSRIQEELAQLKELLEKPSGRGGKRFGRGRPGYYGRRY